ncbi:hypothetical protein M407DRAFT_23918 [Tulasnella calospora MUT 4182]|uniref:Uncharacterized protein n=1 Tax=Tulasnella calospora MUT 4182 TaxID=1051891 RepID=A0A0C3Q9U4_9AGAM|nr:hypothetical protein M407DRAFT_23918 [Tulasnella calospora MUT 4182]
MRLEFNRLWELYNRQKSQFEQLTAVKEFFSQKAHSEVVKLWAKYRDLRNQIEDLATQRVTMRVSQAADVMATSELRNGGFADQLTGAKRIESPEIFTDNPFVDSGPSIVSPFSNPQYA